MPVKNPIHNLEIIDAIHFAEVVAFAQEKGCLPELMKSFTYLCKYSDEDIKVRLYKDNNDNHDFGFSVCHINKWGKEEGIWFNGAVIFHQHSNSWGVHT
jgi:hypothetical protein